MYQNQCYWKGYHGNQWFQSINMNFTKIYLLSMLCRNAKYYKIIYNNFNDIFMCAAAIIKQKTILYPLKLAKGQLFFTRGGVENPHYRMQ